MLEILIIIGFIVGCQIDICTMKNSKKVIYEKSLIEYFLK